MTTDYSALTNAELWDYYQANENFLADFWAEISSRGGLAELEVFALRQKLDAARAEAQRLREQRDKLVEFAWEILNGIQIMDSGRDVSWRMADVEEYRQLVVAIAAEDASAQGGE